MIGRAYLEKGRNLAERVPYSAIALAPHLAVADVFWRSGQTCRCWYQAQSIDAFGVR
jgi:hypothetical protein